MGPPLDDAEARRWWRTAEAHTASTDALRARGLHSNALLLAEQAAQCGLKGLLHGVGRGDLARGHSLPTLAARGAEHAALELDEALMVELRWLAREYEPSRYPDALPEGIAPPEAFTLADAERAARAASAARGQVEDAWRALVGAANDAGGPESDEPR